MNKKYEKVVKIMAKYVQESTQIAKCNGDLELITIVNKINRRAENRPYADTRTNLKTQIKLRIEKRLKVIAKSLPDEGYSMGSKVVVRCGKFTGTDDRRQYYSNSCKYNPTHGHVTLTITPAELRNIVVIGGLPTYIYPGQKGRTKKCYWYTGEGNKQYYRLKKVDGYICDDYHHIDKKAAIEGANLAKWFKKQAQDNKKLREKQKQNEVKAFNKALRKQFTYEDSLKVNCQPGTDAFILRCGLDKSKKYRGSFLLNIAKQKSTSSVPFVERMIKSKV